MSKYFVFVPYESNIIAFPCGPINQRFQSSEPELVEIRAENDIDAKRIFKERFGSVDEAKLLKEIL